MNRTLVFWSLNDKLDREQISRSIMDFKEKGINGFFLHARAGLRTPYMSNEWFEMVRFAAETAYSVGLDAYLYDEDGWPSGFAGGRVPACGKEFQQTWLLPSREKGKDIAATEDLYCVFDENKKIVQPDAVLPEEDYLVFRICRNPAYADLLNPECVREFIRTTHEEYKKRMGDLFGTAIKGIFTDEPQMSNYGFPYTSRFDRLFRERYGEDFRENCRLLLERSAQGDRFRYRYRRLISALYRSSFSEQIGNWCNENGLIFTGHMAAEDGLYTQIQSQANVSPHYKYFSMPGIDHLCLRKASVVLLKQVTSAARQYGKDNVLSETFGCAGWNATPAQLLDIWFRQVMFGVNVACMHLSAYSITGRRKRDYPPSFSYHSSWWEKMNSLSAPVQKLGDLAHEGRYAPKIAVISPLMSFFAKHDNQGYHPELIELTVEYRKLLETLLSEYYDFDIVDEEVLEDCGRFSEGKLIVGKASYDHVIVPKTYNISSCTAKIFREMIEQDASLYFVDAYPTMTDGEPDETFRAYFEAGKLRGLSNRDALLAKMLRANRIEPLFRLYDEKKQELLSRINVSVAEISGGRRVFVHNYCKGARKACFSHEGKNFSYCLQGMESIVLDLLDGGAVRLYSPFSGRDSLLLPNGHEPRLQDEKMLLWKARPLDENVLTLDEATAFVDGKQVASGNILHVSRKLYSDHLKGKNRVKIRYTFFCEDILKDLDVAVENCGDPEVTVNGKPLRRKKGYFIDRNISRFSLNGKLVQGENVLDLDYRIVSQKEALDDAVFETEKNRFFYDTEFEAVYLTGHFTVRAEKREWRDQYYVLRRGTLKLCAPVREMSVQCDLQGEGYPFYRGKTEYTATFRRMKKAEKTFIRIPYAGPVAELYVNGSYVRDILGDFEAEITDHVRPGLNSIRLVAYNSNRNALGPHHYFDGDICYVGPDVFMGEKGWEDNFSLKTPVNLIPQTTFVKDYFILKEGFTDQTAILYTGEDAR